jgi:hypothetical protein
MPRTLMALIYFEHSVYNTTSKIPGRNTDESRYTCHFIVRLLLSASNML